MSNSISREREIRTVKSYPENALSEAVVSVSIGVLICTYCRSRSLAHLLDALEHQRRPPDDVLVIVRETDRETREYFAQRNPALLPVRILLVQTPGLIAARNVGLDGCRTDIVAMIDDDAVPTEDWLDRILEHFVLDPGLGGVGGRDRCYDGMRFDDRQMRTVGKLQWFGRMIGYHHLGFGEPREVDMLKGANMSYRHKAVDGIRFDTRLRGAGSQPYEDFTFSMSVRRQGWKLLYDPQILVEHYEGPRDEVRQYGGARSVKDIDGYRNFIFNGVVVRWEELSLLRHVIFLVWSFFIGDRLCPGIAQAVRFTPVMGVYASWHRFWLAQREIAEAYLTLPRAPRVGHTEASHRMTLPD